MKKYEPLYNNYVLVGNWSEERLKNEFDLKVFLRKRERKELILQRSRTLFSNLLKERPLMISGMFALYGYNVQAVASDMPAKNKIGGKTKYGLALSSLVTARQVDCMDNIGDGCMMTLSPITSPCCRNTFVVVHTKDESIRGEKLLYGDEFYLRAENYDHDDDPPLYVRYITQGVPGPRDRMPIQLSSTKDTNCRWTVTPLHDKDHIEKWGTPVVTGEKLILKNCVAGQSLYVMNQTWMQTFFGPECGVTCRDSYNSRKTRTAENIFALISDIATKKKE